MIYAKIYKTAVLMVIPILIVSPVISKSGVGRFSVVSKDTKAVERVFRFSAECIPTKEEQNMLKMEYYRLALIASAKSGIPADWIYAQWAHETADFTSELCLSYNNFGGVTQVDDNGLAQPDGAYYYMRFDTPVLFAEYFGDYLNLYHDDGIHAACTLYDYVMALHAGGYFGDDPDNYYYGCNRFYREVIKNGEKI